MWVPDEVCHYCQQELMLGHPELGPTKDHIVPRSRNGVDLRWNWITACRGCNSRKADEYPTCGCAKCSRSRRRHWEMFKINRESGFRNPNR